MSKKGYRGSEVCKLVEIQPYVLRYWETEFPELQSEDGGAGQRVYGEDELAIVRRIRELLYDEGFTIAGAKKRLAEELASGAPQSETVEGASPRGPEEDSEAAQETQPKAKKKRRGKKSTKKSKEKAQQATAGDDGSEAARASRVEELTSGIRTALEEARAILEALED